jgi:membrane protein YdbS with pleckstrin-like domain
MTRGSVRNVVVNENVAVAVSLVGVVAACAAAYHVGKTGNWEPLSAVTMGLALIVLFVTSEK